MHIVMVGPFGLRRKGTMRARALPLARALVARGHRVTVLLPPWDSPQDAERTWEDAGVRVEHIRLPRQLSTAGHLAITRRLVQRVFELRPDVVHAFKPKAYSGLVATVLWGLRRVGRARPRLVVDTDDWEGPGGWNEIEPYTWSQRRFFAWQERWGLTHCDAVTVASRALQTLVWGLGVAPEAVHYVPNGADAGQIRSEAAARVTVPSVRRSEPTVLLYTRFVEFRVARLVAIWQRVCQAVPEARLIVVGRGLRGEERAFLQQITARGLRQTVRYLGWPGTAVVPGLLAATDVAILPFDDTLVNRTKCSMRLVELMAAGVPVVADRVGQNAEYIEDGRSGRLVPAGDVRAFATAVIELLRDEGGRRAMGTAAAARIAAHFTWQRLVLRVEQAYQGAG